MPLFCVGDGSVSFEFGEWEQLGFEVVFLHLLLHDWVVVPEDERIVFCLVLCDSHLCIHIVLHLEVVAVKVVGCDVHENRDIGLELVHVVELETTELNHVIVVILCRNL